MISKNKFDYFIKKNLVDVFGNDCFGYEIEDKSYDIYYNKEAYNKFISKIGTYAKAVYTVDKVEDYEYLIYNNLQRRFDDLVNRLYFKENKQGD